MPAKRMTGSNVLRVLDELNSDEEASSRNDSSSEFRESDEGEDWEDSCDDSPDYSDDGQDVEEDDEEEESSWRKMTTEGNNFSFLEFTVQNPGIQLAAADIPDSELGFFQLFFTDKLLQQIVEHTNAYAQSRLAYRPLQRQSIWKTWSDVTLVEMKAYLGVIINMGLNDKPHIFGYFTKVWTTFMPFFSDVFTRTRFLQIHWMLHVSPVDPPPGPVQQSRDGKVRDLVRFVQAKCTELYIPHQDIAVDESTIAFKGRVSFRMYNPMKPTKWGLRVYVLAESLTGYISVFEPYYGKVTTENLARPDLPFATRIVVHLLDRLLQAANGTGFHVFIDRFYTSYRLALEALNMEVHLTGTVQKNRKDIPLEVKRKKKMERGAIEAYDRDDKVMILMWQDKRLVTMMTTYYDASSMTVQQRTKAGLVPQKKPTVIACYTKNMGGVDRSDHLCGSYNFERKSVKWWRKVFYWILEVCITNSFHLYNIVRQNNDLPKVRHLAYRLELVEQLIGNIRSSRQKRGRPSTLDKAERLDNRKHFVGQAPKNNTKDCAVCSDRKTPGGRKKTVYFCKTCSRQPGLHPTECFEKYHTKQKFKN